MRYIGSDAVFYPLPLQKCRFLKGIASNNTKPEAMRFEGGERDGDGRKRNDSMTVIMWNK